MKFFSQFIRDMVHQMCSKSGRWAKAGGKVGIEESRNSLKDHAMRYFLLDPIGVEKLVP